MVDAAAGIHTVTCKAMLAYPRTIGVMHTDQVGILLVDEIGPLENRYMQA